ncbi:MAG: sugar-binding domain-containing protein [Eubacteriales bacterium]|jgi:deoxyribonucleoside regulator
MNTRSEKLQKLARVANLYYVQDQTQQQIAQTLGVSRPLISRMLREAKELGVVEIRIHQPGNNTSSLLGRAGALYGIQGGVLVSDADDDYRTNRLLVERTVEFLRTLHPLHMGIGWGHIVGELVSALEKQQPEQLGVEHICPLVGNSGISIRNYHSNENVRILAQQWKAQPHYLYTPAFAETRQERELLQQTQHYKEVQREWEQLDVALVNIGNYPSTPDFASGARYGTLLTQQKAVGRLIAYYFNQEGQIIHSDTDYAIQIPLELLKNCRHVIGLCSANTNRRALEGALRTGLITHVAAREQLLREVMKEG